MQMRGEVNRVSASTAQAVILAPTSLLRQNGAGPGHPFALLTGVTDRAELRRLFGGLMKTWKNIGILAVSALSLSVVACSGSDGAKGATGDPGAAGAKGDPGDSTPASVGVIVPNIGLLDRELDVTITTNGVDLTQGAPTIDVGSGVTVSNIQVLSSTTMYAHFKVDGAATTGARDLKVMAGSNSLTSKGGFKVAAPMAVTLTPGTLQQGGFSFVDVDNLDTQHAFDNASVFGTYTSFVLAMQDGFDLAGGPLSVTATHAEGVFLVDPLAPATTNVIGANLDGGGNVVETFAGDSLQVSARAPKSVTVGTPLTGENLAAAGATNLYKFTSSTLAIMEVKPTATGAKVAPLVVTYEDSGKAADILGVGSSLVFPIANAAHTTFATVLDSAGGGGTSADYGYDLAVTAHTGTAFAEPVATHNTPGTAAAITAPTNGGGTGTVIVGSLAAGTEEDWYSVTLAQNDNVEAVIVGDFDGTLDLTESTGATSQLDNGPVATTTGARAGSFVQQIAPAGSHPYLLHVTSTDGAAHGNYLISVRRNP